MAFSMLAAVVATGCGDDAAPSASTTAPTTTTTIAETSTTSPEPVTTTTTPPVPEPGTLGSLTTMEVEDPLMGSGFHDLAWADDALTFLSSSRPTTGVEGEDLIAMSAVESEAVVTGLDVGQVVVRVWLAFTSFDVPPSAVVVYTPGPGRFEATTVIDDVSLEAALRGTTDYAAVAPAGEPQLVFTVLTLDMVTGLLIARVTVRDIDAGQTVYEGEISCDFSAGLLECVTLTDDGVLRPGDAGEAVEALQEDLKTAGYFYGALDGKYGPKTEAAVRAFQTDYLLAADGRAGPVTMGLLSDVVTGKTSLVVASKNGVGTTKFGTGFDAARAALIGAFGTPDTEFGWYQDACDGKDWYYATWDGFTAFFTDRTGARRFDGWHVDDLSDLPANLLIAGGIRSTWRWGELQAIGAEFFSDYLGDRWRISALGYTNGRFATKVSDPPSPDARIKSFGTGTGGFESC